MGRRCYVRNSTPAAPLTTAPFFSIEVKAGNIGTAGGLRANTNAQVVNSFGEVIPRLYAAGNNSGIGGPGLGYGGGGGTIGPCMTFGYIAGHTWRGSQSGPHRLSSLDLNDLCRTLCHTPSNA